MASGNKDFLQRVISPEGFSRLQDGTGGTGLAGAYPNGRIIYFDAMQGAPADRWTVNAGTAAVDATKSVRQSQSYKLTTAATIGSPAEITKGVPLSVPASGHVGLEASFLWSNTGATWTTGFNLNIQSGFNLPMRRFFCQLVKAAGVYTLQLSNIAGSWQTVYTLQGFGIFANTWFNMKLVGDLNTGAYASLTFSGQPIVLPVGISSPPQGLQTGDGCFFGLDFSHTTNTTTAESLNLDDIVATVDEP